MNKMTLLMVLLASNTAFAQFGPAGAGVGAAAAAAPVAAAPSLVVPAAALIVGAPAVVPPPGTAVDGGAQAPGAQPVCAEPAAKKKKKKPRKGMFEKFLPILILLVVVGLLLSRLPAPKFDGADSSWRTPAFRKRRMLNWMPLGLTYAFLYMGRYNLTVSKKVFGQMRDSDGGVIMGNEAFGIIFAAGTVVYGLSFLINGPLTDRLGGRFAILMGAGGSCVINLVMGLAAYSLGNSGPMSGFIGDNFVVLFSVLYALNMYFQSFGAVAIVKVNSAWFHLRERGEFGAIFGILISLGVYFAFDIGGMIIKTESLGLTGVFLVPTALLAIFWVINLVWVKNEPGQAGLVNFDTADASSGDDGPQKGSIEVFKMMLSNPVIVTIALVEFCSGFLRQAIMQWYQSFAEQTDAVLGLETSFVNENWGMLLCVAGITGGVFAGLISDRVFQSRRGPVACVLYGVMLIGAVMLAFTFDKTGMVGPLVIIMSMAVIGVHGMLSGTASMDFGGKKNVGIAVGIIDGFVYLGTGVMAVTYAFLLPETQLDSCGNLTGPATDPANWIAWPVAMIPMALIGMLLAWRVWDAKPKTRKAA
jgi:OPA family glycerol-3-phosphate transporter-like MFS transporter